MTIRKTIWFLVVVFMVSTVALTGQYLHSKIDQLRITSVALTNEYGDLERKYIRATSNDGYSVPNREYLVFPFFPDDGIYVTSMFDLRSNPFEDNSGPLIEEKVHYGIDIVDQKNSAIRATVSGTVVRHWPPPNGYWKGDGVHGGRVIIRDDNGVYHAFSHLSETYVSSVKGKNHVEAGVTVIGRMGSSGKTTGPHLHYEIFEGTDPDHPTRWFDPLYYFDVRIGDFGKVLFPNGTDDELTLTKEK